MTKQLVSFETAKAAKEKGFNIEGQVVFDLKNENTIVNFKDTAIHEFIKDCETGYRDKSLHYFKDRVKRLDDNSDEGYYLLAPTQSLLQKWLREEHNINIWLYPQENVCWKNNFSTNSFLKYEDCLENALSYVLTTIKN
jgi:hypothetical protein